MHVKEAKRVLRMEAEAVLCLAEKLNNDFTKAMELIININGRVICAGMGKSGHIARKISSTFASTGTISSFVHPAEASHGDLGMITSDDLIIVFSNSGNTSELSDLLLHSQRNKVKIIGITANINSTLAKVANVSIILPKFEEACPLGLAPTTSTTMMLALGDAIAIAVLKIKGFSASDFAFLHPGGQLGQRLLTVGNLMCDKEKIPLVKDNSSMQLAIDIMNMNQYGCVGIVNKKGKLIGIITDGDIRRNLQDNILHALVCDVMSCNPITVNADAMAEEALAIMNKNSITVLFVLNNTQIPIGILHMHDCLKAGLS